jgi:DNA repair protein RecO (recombination protein O)
MLFNTRGIVFQKFKYSESAIITKIYTEEFGVLSFIIRGLKSKKSTIKIAYFEPLTILDLVVLHREGKELHQIKEIKVIHTYNDLLFNRVKQSILLFLYEILIKTLREETPNKPLFDWLFHALTWLDLTEKNVINFHLVFLFQFSRFLGFYPKFSDQAEVNFFDLQEGLFQQNQPEHPNYISGNIVHLMAEIGKSTFEDSYQIKLGNANRRQIVDFLVRYYQLHMPNIHQINSLDVLQSIME